LGIEIFAALAQVTRLGTIRRAADFLKPELDEQRRAREEDVKEDGAACEGAAEEEGAEEPEEEVHGEGEEPALVELGRVASSLRLCCFLHTEFSECLSATEL
jgi:hypothetical protein